MNLNGLNGSSPVGGSLPRLRRGSSNLSVGTVGARSVSLSSSRRSLTSRELVPTHHRHTELSHRTISLHDGSDTRTARLREQARQGALPSREQLMELAGAPKKDIRLFYFFGPVVKRMSTGYKDVLDKMDGVNREMRRLTEELPMDNTKAQNGITRFKQSLTELENSVDQYLDPSETRHSRRERIQELKDQIAAEKQLLDDLSGHLGNNTWPARLTFQGGLEGFRQGFDLDEAFDISHTSITPKEARPYVDKGFSIDEAVELKGAKISPRNAKGFKDLGLSVSDMKAYAAFGLTPAEVLEYIDSPDLFREYTQRGLTGPQAVACRKAGMTVDHVREYRRLGIPISKNTILGELREENLTNPMTKLGSGVFNTVFRGNYRLPNGEILAGVYKEEELGSTRDPDKIGWVESKTGIDRYDPQLGMRNIATYKINRLLGFNVIPRTEFGTKGGKLGIVMGMAPGTSPISGKAFEFELKRGEAYDEVVEEIETNRWIYESDPDALEDLAEMAGLKEIRLDGPRIIAKGSAAIKLNFSDPALRRELNRLQWMDALCAQGDRHAGNYFVEMDNRGRVVGVTGIDNDQAFGKNVRDPNTMLRGNTSANRGFWGCKLPEVIDTDTRDAVMKITHDQIEESLRGLVTDEEIQSTRDRLDVIQHHIQDLEISGRVIRPNQWSSARVTRLLSNPDTSYVARDSRWVGIFQRGGQPVRRYRDAV